MRPLRRVPSLRSSWPRSATLSARLSSLEKSLSPIMARLASLCRSSMIWSKASCPMWQGRRRSPSRGSLSPVSMLLRGTTKLLPSSMRRRSCSRGVSNSTTLARPAGVSMMAFFLGARPLKSLYASNS